MNEIKKTYKNYVGGKYVRSESGKTFRIELKNEFYEVLSYEHPQVKINLLIELEI